MRKSGVLKPLIVQPTSTAVSGGGVTAAAKTGTSFDGVAVALGDSVVADVTASSGVEVETGSSVARGSAELVAGGAIQLLVGSLGQASWSSGMPSPSESTTWEGACAVCGFAFCCEVSDGVSVWVAVAAGCSSPVPGPFCASAACRLPPDWENEGATMGAASAKSTKTSGTTRMNENAGFFIFFDPDAGVARSQYSYVIRIRTRIPKIRTRIPSNRVIPRPASELPSGPKSPAVFRLVTASVVA